MLVGYGTKMGLAPFHTWLPDAHSEAPSVASALLSGALLNCAFLGILRIHQVCLASGLADFSEHLLLVLGLLSMAVAAIFITGQVDYKRMLAYSSVEHMGILAVGVGLGGAGLFGAMLHVVNHSLTKAMLFLVAGNLLAVYRTKTAKDVSGASARFAGVRPAMDIGLSCHHRLAAIRTVLERIGDPQGSAGSGAGFGCDYLSGFPGDHPGGNCDSGVGDGAGNSGR